MKILLFTLLSYTLLFGDVYYYEYGKRVKLTEIKDARESSNKDIKYYKNSAGQKIGVKHEIIAKCKDGRSCKEIYKKYNLTDIKNLTAKILLIKLDKRVDPFKISQKLSLENDIEFAHPNFIKKRKRR